jgi:hypothetical protein
MKNEMLLVHFFWDYYGSILGLFWDYSGIILGLFWDYSGIILRFFLLKRVSSKLG